MYLYVAAQWSSNSCIGYGTGASARLTDIGEDGGVDGSVYGLDHLEARQQIGEDDVEGSAVR